MSCCAELDRLMDRDLARNAQPYQLSNGTIITDIDTEYFLVFGDDFRIGNVQQVVANGFAEMFVAGSDH